MIQLLFQKMLSSVNITMLHIRGYGGIGRHVSFRNIRASNGDMAELVDASDLGSDGVTRAGSSPVILTV